MPPDILLFLKGLTSHHRNFTNVLFVLSSLMYLATQFTWSSVRDLHAAFLFEIECGRARWGDSFTHLESRILQSPVKQSRAGPPRTDSSVAVFFAGISSRESASYPRITTALSAVNENGYNIFALGAGWTRVSVVARHTEFSRECPLTHYLVFRPFP